MTEGVRGNMLINFCKADCLFDGTLENTFVDMMTHGFTSLRIDGTLVGGKTYCQPGSRLALVYFRSSA